MNTSEQRQLEYVTSQIKEAFLPEIITQELEITTSKTIYKELHKILKIKLIRTSEIIIYIVINENLRDIEIYPQKPIYEEKYFHTTQKYFKNEIQQLSHLYRKENYHDKKNTK